jgi:hypothetical protein
MAFLRVEWNVQYGSRDFTVLDMACVVFCYWVYYCFFGLSVLDIVWCWQAGQLLACKLRVFSDSTCISLLERQVLYKQSRIIYVSTFMRIRASLRSLKCRRNKNHGCSSNILTCLETPSMIDKWLLCSQHLCKMIRRKAVNICWEPKVSSSIFYMK